MLRTPFVNEYSDSLTPREMNQLNELRRTNAKKINKIKRKLIRDFLS